MSAFSRALLAGACVFFPPLHGFASEEPLRVVVTPTRWETPVDQVAGSVTVITEEDIKKKNTSAVSDLLRHVPGVNIANNGGYGQTSRAFLRGTNSNHVLVLLDGMPLNDPSDPADAFDFANLTTDHIERIEILRGAQSTLYGSQAIGGVINIISKQGRGLPTQTAFAEAGRYKTARAGVGSSGRVADTSYSAQITGRRAEGISSLNKERGGREKDGNETYTFSGNLSQRVNDFLTAKGSVRYNRANTEFDSLGGLARPADDPLPVNDSRQINARLSGELMLLDGRWMQEMSVAFLDLNRTQITEYFDSLFNIYFGRQQYLGRRQSFHWVHHLRAWENHGLTGGFDYSGDHYDTPTTAEITVDNHALFINDQWTWHHAFANIGARVDKHQTFGRQFTWKVAPGYRIADTGTTLKASYATGFKAPSLSQLFDGASGNSRLNPEKSRGYDAGVEQSLWQDKLTVGATLFRNDIDNLISFDASPPYRAINIGKARTQGVESSLRFRPWTKWSFTAAHSYLLAQDRRQNKQLARRAKHQTHVSADYEPADSLSLGANLRYVSAASDIDYNSPYGRVTVKPFTTVDLYAHYALRPGLTLYGRLDNLFDKRYEEIFGYGQPGISLLGGVKTEF